MKTPWMLLLAIGCGGAPAAPAHKPEPTPLPTGVMLLGSVEAQLASWKPSNEPIQFERPAMAVASARPERCSLRVTGSVVMVDGEKSTLDDAIALCSQRAAVLVEVGEDAGEIWPKLDAAFAAAKVPVLHRGVRSDTDHCLANPLSRACTER